MSPNSCLLPATALFAVLLLFVPPSPASAQGQRRQNQRQQRPQQGQKQNIDLGDLGSLLGGLGGAAAGGGGGGGGEGPGCPNHCSTHTTPEHGSSGSAAASAGDELSPAPKHRIRPYSNGCSVPPFLQESLGDYSHFTQCCDLHDACYMTCGATKSYCDKEFGNCMKRVCSKKFGRTGEEGKKKCAGLADTFVLGVSMFGCGGYTELQREGCDCLPGTEAAERVGEYAREFYDVYNATHPLPDSIVEKYLSASGRAHGRQAEEKHGELLFRLYRKYPQSIEIISRDGQSGRDGTTRFVAKKKRREGTHHAGHTLEDDEAHSRARVGREA